MYETHFGDEKLKLKEERVDGQDISSDMKKEILREEMMKDVIEDQQVSAADLNMLARKRAESIVSFLASKGIDASRLELLESVQVESPQEESEYISTKLELGAK